jgi:hypothetical protein
MIKFHMRHAVVVPVDETHGLPIPTWDAPYTFPQRLVEGRRRVVIAKLWHRFYSPAQVGLPEPHLVWVEVGGLWWQLAHTHTEESAESLAHSR